MPREYRVISADSHLDLNPEVWTHRLSAKWRDRAPKRVKMPNGSDAVVVDGGKPNTIGLTRSVGVAHDKLHEQAPTFEIGAGTGTPERRLREQDQDGVDAEIMFSQHQNVLRQAKDDEFYLDLVHAYNGYLGEEYRSVAPDRLIPMGMIPTTGIRDAIKELEYCAKVGLKGVALTSLPGGHGYPTPEDDEFWAAALDLGMPLTKHGGNRFMGARGEPSFLYPLKPGEDDHHQSDPMAYYLFRFSGDHVAGAMQLAFSGVFDRFPNLQMYWAETMAGWMKYLLWQIDDHYERYMPLIHASYGLEFLERKPSDYIKENNFWGFLHDPVGVEDRHHMGVERIMWASDFAHAASNWPHSRKVIEQDFAGVPEAEKHLMVAGNAIKYFRLED